MNKVPYDLPKDNRLTRMRKRLQGLQRVAAAINDLYIYGVYPSNYPNLTTVLEQAKDHTKHIIKETKQEENPISSDFCTKETIWGLSQQTQGS